MFLQTGFQIQACATAYQPVPQVASQANIPIMMVPAYVNQMATNNAPVMLVPAQNMQQEPATSGVGQMYVQVPLNQMLSGSTQVNAPSQVPGITSYSIRPQSPEEMQVRSNEPLFFMLSVNPLLMVGGAFNTGR